MTTHGNATPPTQKFMDEVRSNAFLWLGQYLDASIEFDDRGWAAVMELYEETFVIGLTVRTQTVGVEAQAWWEDKGRAYSEKAVREMASRINALGTAEPQPAELRDCFQAAMKKMNETLARLLKSKGAVMSPIICDPT